MDGVVLRIFRRLSSLCFFSMRCRVRFDNPVYLSRRAVTANARNAQVTSVTNNQIQHSACGDKPSAYVGAWELITGNFVHLICSEQTQRTYLSRRAREKDVWRGTWAMIYVWIEVFDKSRGHVVRHVSEFFYLKKTPRGWRRVNFPKKVTFWLSSTVRRTSSPAVATRRRRDTLLYLCFKRKYYFF